MTAPTDMRVVTSARLRWHGAQIAWNVMPFVVLVLAWYLLAISGTIPSVWLPSPTDVFTALRRMVQSGEYARDIEVSLRRLTLGFILSAGLGVSLGIIMGIWPKIGAAIMPLASFFSALSGIVWVPIAILWFGLGSATVAFIIWNSMFWVVLFNTLLGVQSVPAIYESALLTMGGRKARVVRDVVIPGALPNIVTGFRLGLGFGWRGLISAEIFAASSGLGFQIYNASYYLHTDVVIGVLITIGVIWLAIDRLCLAPLEKRTIQRWGSVRS